MTGFQIVSNSKESWLGTWTSHGGSAGKWRAGSKILPYQKINHIPGGEVLGRKDLLWNSIKKAQSQYSLRDFSYVPRTFLLPNDRQEFEEAWNASDSTDRLWITKPVLKYGPLIKWHILK
jgi:tubulin polyglutamylase TTLL4